MTLRELAEDYGNRVAAFVRERKEAGWGNILATSANFTLDYENERKCVLQQFGDKDFITLAPAEFRIIDSVILEPHEKLNGK